MLLHAIDVWVAVTPNDVLRYMNLNTFVTILLLGKKQYFISSLISMCEAWQELKTPLPWAYLWKPWASASRRKRQGNKGDLQTRQSVLGQEFVVMHDLSNWNVLSTGWSGWGAYNIFWKSMVHRQWWTSNYIWCHKYMAGDATQLVLEHIQIHEMFPNALNPDWIGPKMLMMNELHHEKLCGGSSILMMPIRQVPWKVCLNIQWK